MRLFGRFSGWNGAWVVAALLIGGCGEDSPPYDALPLRDALRAAPEVMATLPAETLREVAERLEEAGKAADAPTSFAGQEEFATIDALAVAADEAREDEGKDALVLGEIAEDASGLSLEARPAEEAGTPREEPPVLRGRPGIATAALEETALRGRGGARVRALAKRTGVHAIVRTTGLPMGAWAYRDTLYVNASWLVALSALEGEPLAPQGATPGIGSTKETGAPRSEPLSVDYNPYKLPDSVLECANQVTSTCACATTLSCTHATTDFTFSDANEECTWVNQAADRAAALCVLALMNIDGVRACVESARALCSSLPVTTRDDALAFVANGNCMQVLDQCLAEGSIDTSPPPSSGSSSCDGCGSCSSCDKCNDDWSSCNDNCADCNQNCKDCNDNCKSTGAPAAYAGSGRCTVAPPRVRSPLPSPVGTAFWLTAPIAYLYLLARRRRPR